jgi:hypothetical protein
VTSLNHLTPPGRAARAPVKHDQYAAFVALALLLTSEDGELSTGVVASAERTGRRCGSAAQQAVQQAVQQAASGSAASSRCRGMANLPSRFSGGPISRRRPATPTSDRPSGRAQPAAAPARSGGRTAMPDQTRRWSLAAAIPVPASGGHSGASTWGSGCRNGRRGWESPRQCCCARGAPSRQGRVLRGVEPGTGRRRGGKRGLRR